MATYLKKVYPFKKTMKVLCILQLILYNIILVIKKINFQKQLCAFLFLEGDSHREGDSLCISLNTYHVLLLLHQDKNSVSFSFISIMLLCHWVFITSKLNYLKSDCHFSSVLSKSINPNFTYFSYSQLRVVDEFSVFLSLD